jgi:hypothetical protein
MTNCVGECVSVIINIEVKLEPTPEQLKSLYQRSVRVTALLLPINLVRLDSRTNRIVMLVGDTI